MRIDRSTEYLKRRIFKRVIRVKTGHFSLVTYSMFVVVVVVVIVAVVALVVAVVVVVVVVVCMMVILKLFI